MHEDEAGIGETGDHPCQDVEFGVRHDEKHQCRDGTVLGT